MATSTKKHPKSEKITLGKEMPLTDEDMLFIEKTRKEHEALSKSKRVARFNNVLHKSGSCGFASSGSFDYILNTNPRKNYTVTIQTNWRNGIDTGEYIDTYNVPAGGKVMLGCSQTSNIPVTTYNRRVVGEV